MHDASARHAVCTNPATCTDSARRAVPPVRSWHYSSATGRGRSGGRRRRLQQPRRLRLLSLDRRRPRPTTASSPATTPARRGGNIGGLRRVDPQGGRPGRPRRRSSEPPIRLHAGHQHEEDGRGHHRGGRPAEHAVAGVIVKRPSNRCDWPISAGLCTHRADPGERCPGLPRPRIPPTPTDRSHCAARCGRPHAATEHGAFAEPASAALADAPITSAGSRPASSRRCSRSDARAPPLPAGGGRAAPRWPRSPACCRSRALQAMAQEQDGALEKKDLKIGFIPITCATPLIMADPLGLLREAGPERRG